MWKYHGTKLTSFVIKSGIETEWSLLHIHHKYMKLLPNHISATRSFINYWNENCTAQAVGVNTFTNTPYEIAKCLHLENPELNTERCLVRSSETLLAGTEANLLELKGEQSHLIHSLIIPLWMNYYCSVNM